MYCTSVGFDLLVDTGTSLDCVCNSVSTVYTQKSKHMYVTNSYKFSDWLVIFVTYVYTSSVD